MVARRRRFWFRALPVGVVLLAAVAGCASSPSTAAARSGTGTTAAVSTAAVAGTSSVTGAQGASPVTATSVPAPTAGAASTAAALPDCTPVTLQTRAPGVITLATADPLASPWFTGADPATSDGYEARVAQQVAVTLGFPAADQRWVVVDGLAAVNGSEQDFDLFLHQVSGTGTGTGADLSSGYFSITDAVLTRSGATPAGATGLDYSTMRVGVLENGTGHVSMAERGVTPSAQFDSAAQVTTALAAGTIDVAILPITEALRLADADPGLSVLGQLPIGRWQPDQFHIVLPANSPLTPCVSAAVDRLRIEGALDRLTQQWVTIPVLG